MKIPRMKDLGEMEVISHLVTAHPPAALLEEALLPAALLEEALLEEVLLEEAHLLAALLEEVLLEEAHKRQQSAHLQLTQLIQLHQQIIQTLITYNQLPRAP